MFDEDTRSDLEGSQGAVIAHCTHGTGLNAEN